MLQELTNKIKKIIPEIEELDYKCRVRHNGINKSYWELIMLNKNEEPFEIIGRDITLEDVLRCLGGYHEYAVCSCGEILQDDKTGEIKKIAHWLLGKPLHEQSDETIKELNKLI